jgi:hypothetical protein
VEAVLSRKTGAREVGSVGQPDRITIASRARSHRPDQATSGPVPLTSLSGPQRRLVTALLEAARAAGAKKAADGRG